jgi:hypothetical protein
MQTTDDTTTAQFLPEQYFNYEELTTLLTCDYPIDVVVLIANKVKTRFAMHGKLLYKFDPETVLYEQCEETSKEDIDERLLNYIWNLIQESHRRLVPMEKENFRLTYKEKGLGKLFNKKLAAMHLTNIKDAIALKQLGRHKYGEVHFRNGYLDAKTKELKKRDKAIHFLSSCAPRGWKHPTEKSINRVKHIIGQVYPVKEELDSVLSELGYALSGMSIHRCQRTRISMKVYSSRLWKVVFKPRLCIKMGATILNIAH